VTQTQKEKKSHLCKINSFLARSESKKHYLTDDKQFLENIQSVINIF